MSCDGAGTVGLNESAEIPSLDSTGVAFTFSGAANIDFVACGEDVCFKNIAHIYCRAIGESEFSENLLGGYISLLEVSAHGLVYTAGFDVAVSELNSLVAVLLDCLFLDCGTGTYFKDGYGNNISVFVKKLSHADFLSDKTFLHFCFSSCQIIG